MENIKDIISKVFKDFSLQKPLVQEKTQRIWLNIISPDEAKHSIVKDIQNGTLLVYVDSSVRLFSFNLKRKRLLDQLREEVLEIKNLQFKVGKVL